ncbi:MAG: O-antigen ligase family protein [Armatimonadota bacterium]|nr:O-antigen ligase family protein [bacterium]
MRRRSKQIPSETSYQRAGSWALTLTVALLPLVFWPTANNTNLAKPLLIIAGLLVICGIFVARIVDGERLALKPHALDICVGAYALVVSASWIYSDYRHATIGAIRICLTYTIFYFAARLILTNDRARARLVSALLWGCIGVSLVGIYERFGNLPWGDPNAVVSTWFNRTYLAAYLMTVIPVSIWAMLGKRRALGLVCAALSIPALVFTSAKIAWPGIMLMMAVALAGAWPILAAKRKSQIGKAMLSAVVLCVAIQIVAGWRFPQRSPARLVAQAFSTQTYSSNTARLGIMKTAFRVGMRQPVIGGGAGTFSVYAPGYAGHECSVNIFDDKSTHGSVVIGHAHNEFLEVFADMGILGLIAFMSMLAAAVWMLRQLLRRQDISVADKSLAVALAAGITGFLSANMVGISARVPGEAGFLYLFLALIGSIDCMSVMLKAETEPQCDLRPKVLVTALSAVFVMLLAIGWSSIIGLRSSVYIQRGELVLTDAYDSSGAAIAIDQFRTACALTPKDPQAWYELGNALAVYGRHPQALGAYEIVGKLSPGYGRLHFNQGTSLFNIGRYRDAEREMALAYKQDGLPDSKARLSFLRDLLRSKRYSYLR